MELIDKFSGTKWNQFMFFTLMYCLVRILVTASLFDRVFEMIDGILSCWGLGVVWTRNLDLVLAVLVIVTAIQSFSAKLARLVWTFEFEF